MPQSSGHCVSMTQSNRLLHIIHIDELFTREKRLKCSCNCCGHTHTQKNYVQFLFEATKCLHGRDGRRERKRSKPSHSMLCKRINSCWVLFFCLIFVFGARLMPTTKSYLLVGEDGPELYSAQREMKESFPSSAFSASHTDSSLTLSVTANHFSPSYLLVL